MTEREPKKKRYPEASITSHAVTGGLEGAAGIYAVEPLLERFRKGGKGKWHNPFTDTARGHLKKIAIGAAAGAIATAPIGLLVEEIRKKKADRARQKMNPQQKLDTMAADIPDVTEFRKLYSIEEDPEGEAAVVKLPGSSKARAALVGGLTGGSIGGVAGAGLGIALPGLAKRYGGKGAAKIIGKLEQGLGGKAGARTRTALTTAGGLFHIGATVGATQAVESHNENVERSKAIARALRKARQGKTDLEADQKVILFAYDFPEARRKSGYRLDKYEKTIKAREIDRKTGNVLRGVTYGAAAGAALPVRGSIRQRALAGALSGAGLAAGMHGISPGDEYGEESEPAKVTQRRVLQIAGLGTIAGGLISRSKGSREAIRKAFGKIKGKFHPTPVGP